MNVRLDKKREVSTHKIGVHACPYCGKANDAVSSVETFGRPKKGSATVCIQCSGVAVFNQDLTLRPPNAKERMKLAKDFEVQRLIMAIMQINKQSTEKQ